MKALHRIRRQLLILLLMVHCASAVDFSKCKTSGQTICMIHGTCSKSEFDQTEESYMLRKYEAIKNDCARYFIVEAQSLDKVLIEFRDETIKKADGAGFYAGDSSLLFQCKDNKATATNGIKATAEDDHSTSLPANKLACRFTLSATNDPKNMANAFKDHPPATVGNLTGTGSRIDLGFNGQKLQYPCDWSKPLFNGRAVHDDDEEPGNFDVSENGRRCGKDYFNWYKPPDADDWVRINNFFVCSAGTISATKLDASKQELDIDSGSTKCTRKKCAKCACPFCGHANTPNFTGTDGTSCARIDCPKKMLVHVSATSTLVYPNTTIDCTVKGEWKGYKDIVNITCVDEVRCSQLHEIKTDCSQATKQEGKNCTEASLTDSGAHVCEGKETRLMQPGKQEQHVDSFKCNTATGAWMVSFDGNEESVADNTNVYCMEDVKQEDAKSGGAPATGNMSGGKLIGIIVGVAFVVVIIVIVVVLCLRRYFKKKGNRDEMKSVSVTGRGDKKKKNWKLGKSSGSKTSEQISAPPPPPCPDSLNLPNETEPTPQSQQPSSGGGVPPAVGPDTGKPDKPAELIDIKLDSEKRDTEKESKKDGKAKDDPSVVNTVTGTTFDKSKVDGPTGTISTKKTNNESARSDTGTGSKVDGKPKKKLKVKDGKVELDKNGRGMTDDDDYNIDEGAKPVDAVDKNKKPYAPAVDPRKKMINVTVTEDEDGKIQPKNKPQPY